MDMHSDDQQWMENNDLMLTATVKLAAKERVDGSIVHGIA
jgi:hypothetical protein